MIMKRILFIFIFVGSFSISWGQDKAIQKLELLFKQGHYRKVYRKSGFLLDKPEYDSSVEHKFYRALSLIYMAQNQYWLKKNPTAFNDAFNLLTEIKQNKKGQKLFQNKSKELAHVNTFLKNQTKTLKDKGLYTQQEDAQKLLSSFFSDSKNTPPTELNEGKTPVAHHQSELLIYAQKFIGTPYLWGGESPEGFDCSGYTLYVYKKLNKDLHRTAHEQYLKGKKISEKKIQPGDLVFFKHKGKIHHVGIITCTSPLTMIHASSSKGIVTTNIETSSYWSPRLFGFARY